MPDHAAVIGFNNLLGSHGNSRGGGIGATMTGAPMTMGARLGRKLLLPFPWAPEPLGCNYCRDAGRKVAWHPLIASNCTIVVDTMQNPSSLRDGTMWRNVMGCGYA